MSGINSHANARGVKAAVRRFGPPWAREYGATGLARDALSGAILCVLLVPQAMAYASLAGLPVEAGLLTAMVAPVIYALFGRVAAVSMGPVALASLLVAEAVAGLDADPRVAAAVVALETGAMLAVLGLLRMGRLVNFVSEPALLGFTAAAAVLIAASQMPALAGIDAPRAGTLQDALAALAGGGAPDPAALGLGLAALAALIWGDRPLAWAADALGLTGTPRLALVKSLQLLVLVAAAFVAARFLPGLERVPEPEPSLPAPVLPPLDPALWLSLAVPSLTVAVVVFVTGIAVAKSLTSRRRQSLSSSAEALAIGAANVAVGLTGGYAAGVSLSRSALVHETGARSPLASAFGGLIVIPIVFLGAGLMAQLPRTALAALVMSAVVGLVKVADIRGVLRHSRLEGAVVGVTFLATLALGVQWGLAAGALAGVAGFLWSSSLPRVTREGPDPNAGASIWRSVDREGVRHDTSPVLVIRIDRPLYFGNVGYVEDQVSRLIALSPHARYLVLDMRAVTDVDATGLRMLVRMLDSIEERRLPVAFASLQRPVHAALAKQDRIAECRQFDTVAEAVSTLEPECRKDGDPGWQDWHEGERN